MQTVLETFEEAMGRRLATLRTARGLEQHEVAAAIGLTQSLISRLERGGCQITVTNLVNLARLFNMRPSNLASSLYRAGEVSGLPLSTKGSDDGI